jgi:hypothetical protein
VSVEGIDFGGRFEAEAGHAAVGRCGGFAVQGGALAALRRLQQAIGAV